MSLTLPWILAIVAAGLLIALPMALASNRETEATLAKVQHRLGGEIVQRFLTPSELRIRDETALVQLGASIGSSGGEHGGSSPASVYVRWIAHAAPASLAGFEARVDGAGSTFDGPPTSRSLFEAHLPELRALASHGAIARLRPEPPPMDEQVSEPRPTLTIHLLGSAQRPAADRIALVAVVRSLGEALLEAADA